LGYNFRHISLLILIVLAHNYSAQSAKMKRLKLSKFGESVFGPTYFDGKLYYSWDRPVEKAKNNHNEDGKRFFDVFSIEIDQAKVISEPNALPPGVNSVLNDGPISFSKDGKWVFYTQNLHAFENTTVDDDEFKLGIFYREIVNGVYGEEHVFSYNSDSSNFAHPSVNDDGTLIVFSSDAAGGFGGADLYYSELINGEWTSPVNLGESVNSEASESFPTLYNDILYFSSSIDVDQSGLDIFKVPFSKNITSPPVKLETPINSEFDDFGITFINGAKGYITTNRLKSQDNIFYFEISLPKPVVVTDQNLKYCYEFIDDNLKFKEGLSFVWNFSDGFEGNDKLQKHCFENIGEYTVELDMLEDETGYFYPRVASDTIRIYNEGVPSIRYSDSERTVTVIDEFNDKQYTNFYWLIDGEQYFSKEISLKKKPKEIIYVFWGGDYQSEILGVKLITE